MGGPGFEKARGLCVNGWMCRDWAKPKGRGWEHGHILPSQSLYVSPTVRLFGSQMAQTEKKTNSLGEERS